MNFADYKPSNAKLQWQRFCDLLWFHEDLGFWLDISRMKISASELDVLRPRFDKAFQAMDALEKGSIANHDEKRQVGHYWLRNPELAPDKAIADQVCNEVDSIESFGNQVALGEIKSPTGRPFTHVLWIGIGGSGLGPRLIVNALQEYNNGLEFRFLDNIDPIGIDATLDELGDSLNTTLFVVVSKSGSTPEPKIGMELSRYRLEALGGKWSDQSVAITMTDSKLDLMAQEEKWLKRFDLPDWVGGRTSITGAVGLLPLALIGKDVRLFLEGASQMDVATRTKAIDGNPAALLSAAWFIAGAGKGIRDMVVLPYRDRLEVFSRYLQQLIMESLGKKYDRRNNLVNQGLAVYGNKGSTDQHAYVQQLRDGLDNYFAIFVESLKDFHPVRPTDSNPGDYLSGFLQGTRNALTQGGRQSLTITINQLDEKTLGGIIALFERAVGLYGELIDVNAYHQPGVEAGKIAAKEILDLQIRIEEVLSDAIPRSLDDINDAIDIDNHESIFWILRHLTHNNTNYSVEGKWGLPESLTFSLNRSN